MNFSDFSTKFAKFIPSSLSVIVSIKLVMRHSNDIYFNDKILAGILTETKILNNEILSAFSGIGMNVNADITNYPEEIKETATSIYNILNSPVSLDIIEGIVMDAIAELIS
jgi:BirA family biotin operon repressor/biotin-[acetyl-CoA-carboxylase] ligase